MRYLRALAEWLLLIAVCAFVIVTYPIVSMFGKSNDDE